MKFSKLVSGGKKAVSIGVFLYRNWWIFIIGLILIFLAGFALGAWVF